MRTAVERRRLLAAVAVVPVLALVPACSSGHSDTARPGEARQAVDAYVDALNRRSADDLMTVGGVPDAAWSRREAARILADKGGRGWTVKNVRIEYDFGPDVGSARVEATDKSGRAVRDRFTVLREKGDWHLVVFEDAPAPTNKPSSSIDRPA
ncbi:hypothetical protein [Streptomyces olivochromogenes]|uniref:hypothetical protein n=1 Tax=Streptomyces olivochromogenes TaxID=1963 RepID=UPI001F1E06EC|nr:hypothetical protein [Streptomyces olivochromogenes]MCF3136087.1 hypothetical protein [Streptomyces olivochromogenes]